MEAALDLAHHVRIVQKGYVPCVKRNVAGDNRRGVEKRQVSSQVGLGVGRENKGVGQPDRDIVPRRGGWPQLHEARLIKLQ